MAGTFAVDVLACSTCQGRMKLLELVKDPKSIARYVAAAREAAGSASIAGARSTVLEEPRAAP